MRGALLSDGVEQVVSDSMGPAMEVVTMGDAMELDVDEALDHNAAEVTMNDGNEASVEDPHGMFDGDLDDELDGSHLPLYPLPILPPMPKGMRIKLAAGDHTAFEEFDVGDLLSKDEYSQPENKTKHLKMTVQRIMDIFTGRAAQISDGRPNIPEKKPVAGHSARGTRLSSAIRWQIRLSLSRRRRPLLRTCLRILPPR